MTSNVYLRLDLLAVIARDGSSNSPEIRLLQICQAWNDPSCIEPPCTSTFTADGPRIVAVRSKLAGRTSDWRGDPALQGKSTAGMYRHLAIGNDAGPVRSHLAAQTLTFFVTVHGASSARDRWLEGK